MSTIIASNKFHVCKSESGEPEAQIQLLFMWDVWVHSSAFYRQSLGQIKLNVKSTRYTKRITQQRLLDSHKYEIHFGLELVFASGLHKLKPLFACHPL